jgi:glycolate oxidase FAD binding subunit
VSCPAWWRAVEEVKEHTLITPKTPEELADALRTLANEHRTIRLGGNFSKDHLGGAPTEADETVSTCCMNRLLKYDPKDLTVSVEAGMSFANLERTLAEHHQMIPLDPGWAQSTVGGVIGANLSGPRRRLYGTARDMVIGMTFVTLEGKLVQSGGMVVKNVAGLDMAKLMIGSFGTLAAAAVVNFKLFPMPHESRTFVMEFPSVADAIAERDRILNSILQPSAIDLVNWPGAWRLLVRVGGSNAVLDRYARELPEATAISGDEEAALWADIREFTPKFLAAHSSGGVVSTSVAFTQMQMLLESTTVPVIVRAGSGVVYAHYENNRPATDLGSAVSMMERVKDMFDPERLLNRGRLYGRI